ncbi:MAG TPA: iron ABC transporter permease [Dongiaceae bacterium]|nr:iron ABC transporter permease [Dongiaceae bacterium]
MGNAILLASAEARRHRPTVILALLGLGLVASILAATAIGPLTVPPREIGNVLAEALGLLPAGTVDATLRDIVLDLRVPRALAGWCIGALLSTGGATMQGLFRNPLADPGLIGVSSGAALAVAGFIVLGSGLAFLPANLRYYAMPLAAFVGGLIVVLLIQRLAYRDGRTDVPTMLLAGIAVTAIVMAGIGLLTFVSDDPQLRSITFWTLGSLGGVGWASLAVLGPVAVAVLLLSLGFADVLDALMLGEREAYSIGFEVERAKRVMVFTVAAGVGAAVAFTGLIGFVGIIAPHMTRLILGAAHRRLLIGSCLLGGLLVILADTACRMVVAPAELPIGIVTSLVGAPFFLALLLHQQRRGFPAS